MRSKTVIDMRPKAPIDDRETQNTSGFVIKVSGAIVQTQNNYYRAAPGRKVSIKFDIVNGKTKRNDLDKLDLAVRLDKIMDNKKVDEMYLDVNVNAGEFTISGNFTLPGKWVLDFETVNESLKAINSDWKLSGDKVTFLV